MDLRKNQAKIESFINKSDSVGNHVHNQRKELLAKSEQRYKSLFQYNHDAVSVIDLDGRVIDVNPASVAITGYTKEELLHMPFLTLSITDDSEKSNLYFERAKLGEVQTYELSIRNKKGQMIELSRTFVPMIVHEEIVGVYVISKDITDQKEAIREMNFLAYHDPLTSLPNRRYGEEQLHVMLEQAKEKNQRLALMYLDIDRFKYINDTLGHAIGDELLKHFAKRLRTCVEESGFIARLGGDEFIVLLDDIQQTEDATDAAKKIIEAVKQPFIICGYELYITTSIGISFYLHGDENVEVLMKNAEIALYRAKESGKNKYQVHSSSMDVQTYKLFTLANDLNKALERNEFLIHYQPRIDIQTGKICSAEALLRWQHPDWDMVSPEEFISLAEEMGVIVPIGRWVLRTVCEQNKAWQEMGLPALPIAVNFSAQQLMQKDIFEMIIGILEETRLDPRWLEIEITESVMIKNEERILHLLCELKKQGIKISLDDFGAGYSSLSNLKRFKVDRLKIDQSFIRDMANNLEDAIIVKSVIDLAHQLNIHVIAGEVETEDQLTILREQQCDEIQGYIICRPTSADDFKQLMKKGHCSLQIGNHSTNVRENRREYFRIQLIYPLCSDMTIAEIRGKTIETGKTEVLINDIGPGGMRFSSNIKLPINPDILLKVQTQILGKLIELYGPIVRMGEMEKGIYEYGLKFLIDEKERSQVIPLLNELSLRLRQNPFLPNCSFIQTDRSNYFKRKAHRDE